jgi:hypothetical protein
MGYPGERPVYSILIEDQGFFLEVHLYKLQFILEKGHKKTFFPCREEG